VYTVTLAVKCGHCGQTHFSRKLQLSVEPCPEVDIPHADCRVVPTQGDVSIVTGGIDAPVILTNGL